MTFHKIFFAAFLFIFLAVSCQKKEDFPNRQMESVIHQFSLNESGLWLDLTEKNGRWPDFIQLRCQIQAEKALRVYLKVQVQKNPEKIIYHRSRPNLGGKEKIGLFLGKKFLAWDGQTHSPRIWVGPQFYGVKEATHISDCSLLENWDNRFDQLEWPFFENFKYSKGKRKRILYLGGSTAVDNGGENHFPYILWQNLESQWPGKYDIVNLASWGASLLDHRYNLYHLMKSVINYPMFSNYVYRDFMALPYNVRHHDIGFKELRPDLIVLSAVWNDFALPLFTKRGPLPYFNQNPLTYLYGKILVDANLPLRSNDLELQEFSSKTLSSILNNWGGWREGKSSMLKARSAYPFLAVKDYEQGVYDHYFLMLKLLLEEIKQKLPGVPVLLVTLPFGVYPDWPLRERIMEQAKSIALRFFIKDAKHFVEFWGMADRMQRKAAKELSGAGVYFFDLSEKFRAQVHGLSFKEYMDLEIFSMDLMHFAMNGNNYVGDELVDEVVKILER